MPSFDIVSEVNMHEVTNAFDQANREVGTRYDFKGTDARFERTEDEITMIAEAEFQLKQMADILRQKTAARKIDLAALEFDDPKPSGKEVRQLVKIKQGIESVLAKKMVKMVKDAKLKKVQVAIQGEKLRVSGKKRDDLQASSTCLKTPT